MPTSRSKGGSAFEFSDEDMLLFRALANRAAAHIVEARLREDIERRSAELESVLESIPDGVYVGDASGIKLEASELGPVAGLAVANARVVSHSLTVAETAKRLGVDTSRVRQRIYALSLYAFKHRGGWLVPAFQLRRRKLVPGLDAAVSALSPALHPVAVSRWFTTPNSDLVTGDAPVSPIDWLGAGGAPEVVASLAGSIDQL